MSEFRTSHLPVQDNLIADTLFYSCKHKAETKVMWDFIVADYAQDDAGNA